MTHFKLYINVKFVLNYKALLTEFEDEFQKLMAERKRLDGQIDKVAKAIQAITTLAQESNEAIAYPSPDSMSADTGFTDKVRMVMRANPGRPMSAIAIRDVLHEAMPHEDPKIMLIHIHNTLKRLKKQDEIEEIVGFDGHYRWKSSAMASYSTLLGLQHRGDKNDLRSQSKEKGELL